MDEGKCPFLIELQIVHQFCAML